MTVPIKETVIAEKVLTKEQQIEKYGLEINKIYNEDCLIGMQKIKDKSIDMILCDLPYGTTACSWDSTIPLDKLWHEYKRIIKNSGAIVLFGSQPFTSQLVSSNYDWFKYSWVWKKNRATGHVHAKNKPMKIHEDICVFSSGTTVHASQSSTRMPYFPQGLIKLEKPSIRKRNDAGDNAVMSFRKSHKPTIQKYTNYPTSILEFDIEMNEKRVHETQKPLELCKYLIQTYSEKDELILDNCMGSGTTAIACIKTNRKFIGFENNNKNFTNSILRLASYE